MQYQNKQYNIYGLNPKDPLPPSVMGVYAIMLIQRHVHFPIRGQKKKYSCHLTEVNLCAEFNFCDCMILSLGHLLLKYSQDEYFFARSSSDM
jgi:hypothetical protein